MIKSYIKNFHFLLLRLWYNTIFLLFSMCNVTYMYIFIANNLGLEIQFVSSSLGKTVCSWHSLATCTSLCKVEAQWTFPHLLRPTVNMLIHLIFRESCLWDFIYVSLILKLRLNFKIRFMNFFCIYIWVCVCVHVCMLVWIYVYIFAIQKQYAFMAIITQIWRTLANKLYSIMCVPNMELRLSALASDIS